jgi:hypothetical protein
MPTGRRGAAVDTFLPSTPPSSPETPPSSPETPPTSPIELPDPQDAQHPRTYAESVIPVTAHESPPSSPPSHLSESNADTCSVLLEAHALANAVEDKDLTAHVPAKPRVRSEPVVHNVPPWAATLVALRKKLKTLFSEVAILEDSTTAMEIECKEIGRKLDKVGATFDELEELHEVLVPIVRSYHATKNWNLSKRKRDFLDWGSDDVLAPQTKRLKEKSVEEDVSCSTPYFTRPL